MGAFHSTWPWEDLWVGAWLYDSVFRMFKTHETRWRSESSDFRYVMDLLGYLGQTFDLDSTRCAAPVLLFAGTLDGRK